uniref:Uncharacterized protein LOC111113493 n=1 Tax=Crassostrea virginica TaxID=6565 RepID=A0A8B8BXA5_CRAVI|nr:uncharacterized protein LOC111113493 [Crassostrea virginica]
MGVQYTQGQKWYDGCQYICECIDAKAGRYSCSERCAIYPILPSSCILIPDPWDPACRRVPSCPPSTVTTEAQNQNPQTGITTASDINNTTGDIQTSTKTDFQTTDIHSSPIAFLAQQTTIGSRGKEFLILFTPSNFNVSTTKNVYITSEQGAMMNISTSRQLEPILKSQIDRTENISSVEHVIFPNSFELTGFKKESKSAIIKTSEDVFVISHDDSYASVGTFRMEL